MEFFVPVLGTILYCISRLLSVHIIKLYVHVKGSAVYSGHKLFYRLPRMPKYRLFWPVEDDITLKDWDVL
jgi:hypothetical protein